MCEERYRTERKYLADRPEDFGPGVTYCTLSHVPTKMYLGVPAWTMVSHPLILHVLNLGREQQKKKKKEVYVLDMELGSRSLPCQCL